MQQEIIEQDFRQKVCAAISLASEGLNRFRVFNPFLFDDGDQLCVFLKREGPNWLLSDEGHTFMHLSYQLDEKEYLQGTRLKIIDNTLSLFSVQDRSGELVIPVEDDRFGDSLYSFIQALLRVMDVTFLTRERVRSTFNEDFQSLISETVPEERLIFRWHDPQRDPHALYPVDCRINSSPTPVFVFALQNDEQVRDATITLHQFERWKLVYRSLTIFEDQEGINRKVLARYSDIAEKQFSSLQGENRHRIANYLHKSLQTLS
jgi:hypothetical protein